MTAAAGRAAAPGRECVSRCSALAEKAGDWRLRQVRKAVLPLVVAMLAAPPDVDVEGPLDCLPSGFAAAREHLGPSGRLTVETTTVGARLTAWRDARVVWATRVRSPDCAVLAEIADIGVERSIRAPTVTVPVGDVPSLSTPAPPPSPQPTARWHLELGAGAQVELAAPRVGGAVDLYLRRRGLGGWVELGAFAPRAGTVSVAEQEIGTFDYFTVHGLLGLEGCLLGAWLPDAFRPCAGLGGGLEWVDARASGERVFQTEPQSRTAGRLDGTLRLGWAPGPGGLEGWVRATWRPSRPSFEVEGASVDGELPEWTAGIGVRGWLRIF